MNRRQLLVGAGAIGAGLALYPLPVVAQGSRTVERVSVPGGRIASLFAHAERDGEISVTDVSGNRLAYAWVTSSGRVHFNDIVATEVVIERDLGVGVGYVIHDGVTWNTYEGAPGELSSPVVYAPVQGSSVDSTWRINWSEGWETLQTLLVYNASPNDASVSLRTDTGFLTAHTVPAMRSIRTNFNTSYPDVPLTDLRIDSRLGVEWDSAQNVRWTVWGTDKLGHAKVVSNTPMDSVEGT